MPRIVPNMSKYLGQNIKSICPNGFHNNLDNHCAHFVSHIMGFTFGFLCRYMTGKGKGGANIRVHEVFAKCQSVGKWDAKPSSLKQCLAFVTAESNVNLSKKKMANVPKKHIGIFSGGEIYHYSNSQDKVVKQTPAAFAKHYSGSSITVFYGEFPK